VVWETLVINVTIDGNATALKLIKK